MPYGGGSSAMARTGRGASAGRLFSSRIARYAAILVGLTLLLAVNVMRGTISMSDVGSSLESGGRKIFDLQGSARGQFTRERGMTDLLEQDDGIDIDDEVPEEGDEEEAEEDAEEGMEVRSADEKSEEVNEEAEEDDDPVEALQRELAAERESADRGSKPGPVAITGATQPSRDGTVEVPKSYPQRTTVKAEGNAVDVSDDAEATKGAAAKSEPGLADAHEIPEAAQDDDTPTDDGDIIYVGIGRLRPNETLSEAIANEWLSNAAVTERSPRRVGRQVYVKDKLVKESAIKWDRHRPDQDAVLCMGMGYEPRVWHLFAGSLRHVGYSGDIVVACSEEDAQNEDIVALADKYDVVMYPVSFDCDESGMRKRQCTLHDFYEPGHGVAKPAPVSNTRYELLRAWTAIYEPSSLIFIADFRDVLFQLNPFPRFRQLLADVPDTVPAIIAVEETKALFIGKTGKWNHWNAKWLAACFGDYVTDAMYGLSIFCSGTTVANQRGMALYLELELAELTTRQCKTIGGADQGIHNFLMRLLLTAQEERDRGDTALNPAVPEVRVIVEERGIGAVNTLSSFRRNVGNIEDLGLRDTEGYVLNDDRSRSSVVHQWDREKKLKRWVRKTFTEGIP